MPIIYNTYTPNEHIICSADAVFSFVPGLLQFNSVPTLNEVSCYVSGGGALNHNADVVPRHSRR